MKNISIIFILGLLLTAIPVPGTAYLRDAGIILNISGTITYSNKTDVQTPLPVQAFMKIRSGDSICLHQDSKITLYLLLSETRETWHGPAVLNINNSGIKAETTPVHVEKLPSAVARHINRSGLTVPNFRTARTGGVQIRGMSGAVLNPGASLPLKLNERDQAAVRDAEKICENMKKQAQKDDYLPELYLLSVLSKYDQYSKAEIIVDELLKKDEKNPVFNQWKYWIQENYPVRCELFLMTADPFCTGSGCTDIYNMGKYKKTGLFSITQADSINAKQGNILSLTLPIHLKPIITAIF